MKGRETKRDQERPRKKGNTAPQALETGYMYHENKCTASQTPNSTMENSELEQEETFRSRLVVQREHEPKPHPTIKKKTPQTPQTPQRQKQTEKERE